MNDAVRFPSLTLGSLSLGKLDEQLLRLNLDARNVGVDDVAIPQ